MRGNETLVLGHSKINGIDWQVSVQNLGSLVVGEDRGRRGKLFARNSRRLEQGKLMRQKGKQEQRGERLLRSLDYKVKFVGNFLAALLKRKDRKFTWLSSVELFINGLQGG